MAIDATLRFLCADVSMNFWRDVLKMLRSGTLHCSVV